MKGNGPTLTRLLFTHAWLFIRASCTLAIPEMIALTLWMVLDLGLLYLLYGVPITLIYFKQWEWLIVWLIAMLAFGASRIGDKLRQIFWISRMR